MTAGVCEVRIPHLTMPYRLLADATVLLHMAFVAFVVLGGLLVFRWPKLAWIHLPAAAWGAWVECAGIVCPLTPLENWFRARGGQAAYTTDFIEHYLMPVLYPATLSRELQWALGGIVLLVNAGVYFVLLRRRARGGPRRRAARRMATAILAPWRGGARGGTIRS